MDLFLCYKLLDIFGPDLFDPKQKPFFFFGISYNKHSVAEGLARMWRRRKMATAESHHRPTLFTFNFVLLHIFCSILCCCIFWFNFVLLHIFGSILCCCIFLVQFCVAAYFLFNFVLLHIFCSILCCCIFFFWFRRLHVSVAMQGNTDCPPLTQVSRFWLPYREYIAFSTYLF